MHEQMQAPPIKAIDAQYIPRKAPRGTIPKKESLSFGLYYDIIYDKLLPQFATFCCCHFTETITPGR
jgi:hypothetical protein